MRYLLLHDMTGVLYDRTPDETGRKLHFSFDLAPQGATAVFTTNRGEIYRDLTDGACELDATGLDGEIRLTVALFDGAADAKRWKCDGFVLYSLTNGKKLLVPADGDLAQTVSELRIRMETAERARARHDKEIAELRAMYQKIMDGYNIV